MAIDALGLALQDRIKKNNVPVPTETNALSVEKDSYTAIIEFDLLAYRRKHSSKAVKKHYPSRNGSMKKPPPRELTFPRYCKTT